MKPNQQAGSVAIEYVLICAALTAALFVPIQDNPASPDKARSTFDIISEGLVKAYKNFSYATSLPV